MKHIRCEEVLVHLVIRSYDEAGRPVDEVTAGRPNGAGGVSPIKVFRNADTRDFWAWVDKAVAAMKQPAPAAPGAPAPIAVPAKPKRGRV